MFLLSLVGDLPAVELSVQSSRAETLASEFEDQIRPLLTKYCLACHNPEDLESGIRVDNLTGDFQESQLKLWKAILEQLGARAMPPEDELQPTDAERQEITDWISDGLQLARTRPQAKNGTVRRLTVSQYRNTLRELLNLDDDLTDTLPADAVSKEGFLNQAQSQVLSPLLIEAYFDIAERALDLCIVDEEEVPLIQNFRMDFGRSINPAPCPDKLILGANSHLLRNEDFQVEQLAPQKPFSCYPRFMRTRYEFIEGYQGNATVRGWRKYDSIYHAVFACMRGTQGYPKGMAYEVIPDGLLLRPAIPSSELFGESSTYGPKANFKLSLRELPDHGRFRVTVTASRYRDGLLLDPDTPLWMNLDKPYQGDMDQLVADLATSAEANLTVERAGIYQLDVNFQSGEKPSNLALVLGARYFSGELWQNEANSEQQTAFLRVRLPVGPLRLTARYGNNQQIRRILLSRIDDGHKAARAFQVFETRTPKLGVHLGLRRDCGSTLAPVGQPQPVAESPTDYIFEGAIGDFPAPHVEEGNVNYLAGIREIGVRSEYTDGRDLPRMQIQSVEFEGPLYESWPPESHRNIFFVTPAQHRDSHLDAEKILSRFGQRAYRRPLADHELAGLMRIWQATFDETNNFKQSIKDALLVVLTSPQFLFLIESSGGPEPELLDGFELASKLSYFLWDSPPDDRLLHLAQTESLRGAIDSEVDRMIADPRFERFSEQFGSQWLSLDKFDVVRPDQEEFPSLTRDTKAQLRNQPIALVQYLIRNNRPLRELIQCDYVVANEVVANYYGLGDRTESGFKFEAIRHDDPNLGGVLSQAAILAGLSDGREANPIKRGAWLARKILAEPPDDPPPNVPALPEDDEIGLSLREKLERHRNQKGCANCHAGIDPWGLPLEQFNAAGLFPLEEDRIHLDATGRDGSERCVGIEGLSDE